MWLQYFWIALTYSYNALLVLFIATHLFVGAIISFLTGIYSGVYLSQNYEIPRINRPRAVWDKFMLFLEKNRRDPRKVSMRNILHPSTISELVVEPTSPSASETILVPESSETAVFTQAGSQTEAVENDILDAITELTDTEKSEATDSTLKANSLFYPLSENETTLILTEPEDLTLESKRFSSAQILEASLTLNKDKAISRSSNKLN